MTTPGRSCPLHYRYAPTALARPAEFTADTLYVIGGLYGNRAALAAIDALAAAEPTPVTRVYNGDFHWFDVDGPGFAAVNAAVLAHHALRGNVETELAGDDDEAGCGCAYPDSVSDDDVARSNAILARLRGTARGHPALRARLAALPMTAVAAVGGLRTALVHGDCTSLAGWSYDESALRDADGIARAAAHCAAAAVRVIASSHTCLPVALTLDTPLGPAALFNNGAAGLPNFAGTGFGLLTRIATTPAPQALYGTVIAGVHIDAVPVHWDAAQWQQEFLANWPAGSAAHQSYFRRISDGPRYGLNHAMRAGVRLGAGTLRGLRAAGTLA